MGVRCHWQAGSPDEVAAYVIASCHKLNHSLAPPIARIKIIIVVLICLEKVRPTTANRGRINFVAAKQKQITDKVASRTRRRGQVSIYIFLGKKEQ